MTHWMTFNLIGHRHVTKLPFESRRGWLRVPIDTCPLSALSAPLHSSLVQVDSPLECHWVVLLPIIQPQCFFTGQPRFIEGFVS